ncbi:efflux RND transporter periplasmic adaptor subunit [Vibrio variabilis]|uniref:efflux RND transporter periplasmic adaptor subunit n=1 Tax=Vibrio variabilis TaxID=990271 RepID=UPI000DD8C52B|nr:efflux RND transporter periplasmic adaptor subunit [Vibrio variabilis]
MNRPMLSDYFHTKPFLLTVGLSASVLLTGCKSEQSIEQVPVVRPAIIETITPQVVADLYFNGVVRSSHRAELSFRSAGRLVELMVEQGDSVSKGQIIAKLDPVDAEIALQAAKNEASNSQTEYKRALQLYNGKQAISKSQLDEIKLRYQLAISKLEEAERRLDETVLKAPFDGVVGRKYVDNHTLIQGNESILYIHDLEQLEVVIQVPERIMTQPNSPRKVFATTSLFPSKTFDLEVKTFETEPDPAARTYGVTLEFKKAQQGLLLPGMSVRVLSVLSEQEEGMITVPLSAISPDNLGNQYVWVVKEDNSIERRAIETGGMSGERVQVTSQLNAGERVITAGTLAYRPGKRFDQ